MRTRQQAGFTLSFSGLFSSHLCPIPPQNTRFGPDFAFGLPGLLMLIATVVFWLGRKKFVHIPPSGVGFVREFFSGEGLSAIGRLFVVYLFVAVFWSLWDQSSGGEWTLQARDLDLNFLELRLLPEQVQVANPLLILLLVPSFNYVIYPLIDRVLALTPL